MQVTEVNMCLSGDLRSRNWWGMIGAHRLSVAGTECGSVET